jgi:hypothetical protein
MASLSDLETQVGAAAVALPGGTKLRLPSDYSTDERVEPGETGVQVRATLLAIVNADSAVSGEAARVEVVMIRRLAIAQSEQAYMAGDLVADQSALLLHSFWTDLAAVYGFVDDGEPGVNQQPEQIGPLLIYSVLADVALSSA